MIPSHLLDKIRCDNCHESPLRTDAGELHCDACDARYPVKDGIPSINADAGLADQEWNLWDKEGLQKIGNTYYQRATGELPEKESSKSTARLLKERKLFRPGDSLLDIGCGPGHFLRSFRDRLDPGIRYTGVDVTMPFLQWGAEIFGLDDTCSFLHGDTLSLPLQDDSFDIVFVNLFHGFPRVDQALSEVMRVADRLVLWRTPLGEVNYAVKIIYGDGFDELGVLDVEREDTEYTPYMLYTEEYVRGLVDHLGGSVRFVERDTDFESFDNTEYDEFDKVPATKVVNGMQLNGNLLLDWNYVAIDP